MGSTKLNDVYKELIATGTELAETRDNNLIATERELAAIERDFSNNKTKEVV